MKSIVTTYPGFCNLPKGLKQLLLVSETFFFEEAQASMAFFHRFSKRGLQPSFWSARSSAGDHEFKPAG
ncbi:MAG TPA: hypothetical protein VFV81_00440 [Verrucomicrobiae bacterium]|nr:hypothetical protein [Verrucomicrobiae bacterium]